MTKDKQFRELVEQLVPLMQESDEVRLKMMQLSFEMSKEILMEAYPDATIVEFSPLIEVKPTDYAKGAKEAVETLKKHGSVPNMLILDSTRKIITVAR